MHSRATDRHDLHGLPTVRADHGVWLHVLFHTLRRCLRRRCWLRLYTQEHLHLPQQVTIARRQETVVTDLHGIILYPGSPRRIQTQSILPSQ